jgi:hypothetical protein
MKKILTLLFVAIISLNGLLANPVTPERAKQTAANFLVQKATVSVNANKNLKMLKAPSLAQVGDELTVQIINSSFSITETIMVM